MLLTYYCNDSDDIVLKGREAETLLGWLALPQENEEGHDARDFLMRCNAALKAAGNANAGERHRRIIFQGMALAYAALDNEQEVIWA